MADDEGTRRWQRPARADTVSDALQLLRMSIVEIRAAPGDPEARRRLRAIAAEHELWDELALLLADEARAQADRPDVAAAFYEELADVHDNLDQPLETIAAMEALVELQPGEVAHHDRLAQLYRRAGAWSKAADAFEEVGVRAPDDKARAALLAAATLNREHGRLDRAAAQYRMIVERRPTDHDAWRTLDDVLSELGRWRAVAEVRGERADHARSPLEKATLLRAQARALEQAGDLAAAAKVVAGASFHAPEDVSGLVDHADVLARGGKGREAADILRARIAEALQREASPEDVAALRLRLARILEDSCDDRAAAIAVLDELLAASPDHLPALERVTALAASDPDPRAHAAALLRYAAALPGDADRSSYVAAAARRLSEVGDLRGAVRAFEQAAALAPDDDAIRRELVDARTSAIVDNAIREAAAGDPAAAERRLRALVGVQPHHVEANLALADLLAALDRIGDAADHLRYTLETAPEDLPPAPLARLVHRCAELTAALGDPVESHQLLHEAHRLDRGSLAITLALGESCFARKLWRQAVLHLEAAARHPDAGRHAREVAAGLVHAAQAEIRALKPANAGKHYEAAVRIDPACAAAWHGLAEIATERGDLARAAECLEHEATSTSNPADRLRLFDALGDMALDVLGDRARAERCWSQVAGAGSPPLLDKLLALQRRRGATLERGETCERLAALRAEGARKELLVEAAQAFTAGGALDRAVALAEQLIAKHPREPEIVVAATTIALAAGDAKRAAMWSRRLISTTEIEDARAGLELVRALGVAPSDEDRRFVAAYPPRDMASGEAYSATLDEDERRELVDDPAERPLRDVLELLAEIMPLVCPTASVALLDAGLDDARRVAASSDAATAAMYPQIARALGGPPTLLYAAPRAEHDLELLFAAPPVVVIGPKLGSIRAASHGDGHLETDATLRFQLGRIVELSRPHRVFTVQDPDAMALLVAGLRHGFGPPQGSAAPREVVNEAERLRTKLSVALRQRMTERLAAIPPDQLNAHAYVAACQRAADRAGLLACGDVAVAIELAGGAANAPHLVRLASTKRYLAVRRKLRAR
jgi:predicted Zn-dependent protease